MELNEKRLEALAYEFKGMLDEATASIANLKVLLKESENARIEQSRIIEKLQVEIDNLRLAVGVETSENNS